MRVLCVDDNRDSADTLAAVLELRGYETRACYDGTSALNTVMVFHPDACLLDLRMPGMDGLELARRIKASANHRPLLIVATTAEGTLEERTQSAISGFHYHLVKPIDTTQLLDALSRFQPLVRRSEPGSGLLARPFEEFTSPARRLGA